MENLNTNIFYLKKKIIFPHCMINVIVKHSDISNKIKKGDNILTYTIRSFFDILFYKNRMATLSEVLDITDTDDSYKLNLKGLHRTLIKKINGFQFAQYEIINEADDAGAGSLQIDILRKKTQELIFLINITESDKLIYLLNYISDINQLTDFISNYFVLNFYDRYRLYRELEPRIRSNILIDVLDSLIAEIGEGK